ncbi:hypothetical protein [Hyphomicrobium sp.]|jgi:hypothetical protein|uniref:hypothetical protein n=1 Tax=Hyphomicrobium sp. TaxID=82 RepID=UPI003561780A
MIKKLLPLAAAFVVASTVYAAADDWSGKFKTLDTDGSGTISRAEYDDVAKVKLVPAPEFSAIDTDNNNSIDTKEWAASEKLQKGYSTSCKSSTESWCPKK